MKRLFTLLLVSFVAMSCEMVDEKLDDLLGKKDVVVFAEGTELTANVPSKQTVLNYKFESTFDWEVTTADEWLEIDPMRGKAGKDIKIQIKVHKNKDEKSRTGYVDLVVANNDSYRITIKQAGTKDEENDDVVVDIPHNQIWYTSIDGEVVEPNDPMAFNVSIKSNIYEDGKGVITFDGEVTEVGELAFYGCDNCTTNCYNLTSFILPQSVTSIGNLAFYGCRNLQSVTISDNVTHIGYAAFICCTRLKEFNSKFASEDGRCLIIDGVLNSFAPAGLAEYTIPDSVTTIGEYAFYDCYSLTSVTIPDSVTTIGRSAFYECGSLTSVTIGDSVTTIGQYAFYGCTGELVVNCNIPDASYFDSSTFYGSQFTSVTIGDSVTAIGDYAFANCYSLTSVTIPDSVTTIGWWAFYECSSLTSVTIGDGVTTIGGGVFFGCDSLTKFNGKFVSEDGRCLIVDDTLMSFAIGCGATEYVIPPSVTVIGHYAFYRCFSLTSVIIPDGVTTIGVGAFAICNSLTSVTIPDSVTTIGDVAFAGCSSLREFRGKYASEDGRCLFFNGILNSFAPSGLTEYTIPDSVTAIGWNAFSYCDSLTSVTIPDSVIAIGYEAFYGCSSLTNVYCKAITPPTAEVYDNYWRAFDENAYSPKIYVPIESVEAYKSANYWGNYAHAIVGYNFETGEVDDTEVPEEPEEPEEPELSEYVI